jgi:hypothetical protein
MYRYRNADPNSAAKRALRAKLKKNGSKYVAMWRERQQLRQWLHPHLNKIINGIFDYLIKEDGLLNAQYVGAHRQELFTYLRKVFGDLSYGRHYVFSSLMWVGKTKYFVYCWGTPQVRPAEEVPPYEIRFFGRDCRYMQAGRLWVGTLAPVAWFFSRSQMIEETHWQLEIDLFLHRFVRIIMPDLVKLPHDHALSVFPLLLLHNRMLLVTDNGLFFEF